MGGWWHKMWNSTRGVERGAVLCIEGVCSLKQGGHQVQKRAVTNAGERKIFTVKNIGRQITKKCYLEKVALDLHMCATCWETKSYFSRILFQATYYSINVHRITEVTHFNRHAQNKWSGLRKMAKRSSENFDKAPHVSIYCICQSFTMTWIMNYFY